MKTNPDGLKIIGKYKRVSAPIEEIEAAVSSLVTAQINSNQFSALVSFAACRGIPALSRSILLKRVNEGQPFLAARQFRMWTNHSGKKRPSLVRRRESEAKLFLTPVIVVNQRIE